jgi:hypothetical protein
MHNTGTVEAVGKKEVKTKYGMKPTFSLKMDGEWYQCGFTDPRVSAGDEISFEYTDGTYGKEVAKGSIMRSSSAPSTTKRTEAEAPAPKSGTGGAYSRPFPIPPLHGDRAIIRQNALAHATKLVTEGSLMVSDADGNIDQDKTTDAIIHIARQFEAYACGDLDVARAKEIAAKKKLEADLGE